MYLIVVLSALALLADCRSTSDSELLLDIDNDIEPDDSGLPTKAVNKRFVRIAQRPGLFYELNSGATVHLMCEAIGAPAPSVRWFKNDAPVYEYDMESNEVIDSNPSSVGRLVSTLLVNKPGRYTCVVTSGDHSARATSTVYHKGGGTDISERSRLYPLHPRIVVWYKVYVDTIGNEAVLPCRAKGHPRPRITWTDNNGDLVKNDPRMKVLRSGELIISGLRWTDMGEYSCRAENLFGTTTEKTFLYPAKAS